MHLLTTGVVYQTECQQGPLEMYSNCIFHVVSCGCTINKSPCVIDTPSITVCLQLRGVEPSEGNAANPGKIGEAIASNVNGPDPKAEASKVCPLLGGSIVHWSVVSGYI